MARISFDEIAAILKPLYMGKDPAHGLGHIRRIHSKALLFSKGLKVDREAIAIGAALHGIVRDKGAQAKKLLKKEGIPDSFVNQAVQIALESQADAVPKSAEGKVLHDAHLCEGGDYFIPAKCLATSISRGYPLRENYAWVDKNIIRNRKRKCYTKLGKQEYARKMKVLKSFWAELGKIVG